MSEEKKVHIINVTDEQWITIDWVFRHNDWDLEEITFAQAKNLLSEKNPCRIAEEREEQTQNQEREEQETHQVTDHGSPQQPAKKKQKCQKKPRSNKQHNLQAEEDTQSQEREEQETQQVIDHGSPQQPSKEKQKCQRRQRSNEQQNLQPAQNIEDSETEECPHCFCRPCVTTYRQAWLGNGNPPMAGNNSLRRQKYKHFWRMMSNRYAWSDPRYIQKKALALGQANIAESENYCLEVREIMPDCILELVRSLYPNLDKVPYMGHKWI